jgi:hypothetical protein
MSEDTLYHVDDEGHYVVDQPTMTALLAAHDARFAAGGGIVYCAFSIPVPVASPAPEAP